ncbi:hypothetical protein BJ546DRAFT_1129575 [Cryomyces antarcticus]|uniref:DOMON domain-containing protein n=1 Tax=Cryomyces antarcticus TaxID=329879 RepID=A0ABR0M015_9PEZI|nr:hypothetical protein LTR39_000369 [Cryomyces antarcticus]KAK5020636.1 hypothetical protein LTR60_000342 [Cryomyces antarcticus]KAK5257402.1 hypothetical protein LTR16_000768 [Cryomyces antarcticus]
MSRLNTVALLATAVAGLFFSIPTDAQQLGRRANDTNHTSSTFVYSDASGLNLTFALNAATSTGNLCFHMSAPAAYSWVGVGIGKQMRDSLMFIAYTDSSGHGNSEPTYTTSKNLTVETSSGMADDQSTYVIDACCHNCTTWSHGSLDLKSKIAPFIFALGGGYATVSNSPAASIERHEVFGSFTMDMQQATSDGAGGVPQPNAPNGTYVTSGASLATGLKQDNNYGPPLHALVMCLAFVLVFPLGALLLRVLESVKWHAGVQIIGFIIAFIGVASGIYIATMYNKSKSYSSAHQILGLLLTMALLVQLSFGILHHRLYKKHQKPTVMSRIHKYLGPGIILLGLVNGGLGFSFANRSNRNVPYIIIVVLVALVFAAIVFFKKRRGNRRVKVPHNEGGEFAYGGPQTYGGAAPQPYDAGYGREGGAIPLSHMSSQASMPPPPPYGARAGSPPYMHENGSGISREVTPRPMV